MRIPTVSRRASGGVGNNRAVDVNRDRLEVFMLRRDPPRITNDDFREFPMSCVMSEVPGVTIQSDQQPRVEIHDPRYRAITKPRSPSEVDQVPAEVHNGANARTGINGRRVLDFSHEINLANGSRRRFRVNATGIHGRNGRGVEIMLRALPTKTPDMETAGLSGNVIEALKLRNGIVVVAGCAGSGKSTTLAAVTRGHLEDRPRR